MVRKLPSDPAKKRVQHFKRLFQHIDHFRSQLEAGNFELPLIVTIPDTGEDVYLEDLMVGIESLPPRQREAFELICLQGWTETDATRRMLPDSKWSTPVQQYADTALARMIACYDAKQAGTYVHTVYVAKTKRESNGQARAKTAVSSDGGVPSPEPAAEDADG